MVNRVNSLIVSGTLQQYQKGSIKGLSAQTTIEFEQFELNNALVVRLSIPISKWHDDHYRSNEAFASGQIRSYGSIANPSMFRKTRNNGTSQTNRLWTWFASLRPRLSGYRW